MTGIPKATAVKLRYILVGSWYTRLHKFFHIRKVGGEACHHKQLATMSCLVMVGL